MIVCCICHAGMAGEALTYDPEVDGPLCPSCQKIAAAERRAVIRLEAALR